MFPFIFQLIYPKQCCACHEALIFGEEFICLPCLNALPTSHFRQEKSNYLLDLFEGELSIQETFAFAWFSKGSKMQEIMHQIKYKGNKGLARYMGKLLAKAQQHRLLHSKIQALVPVPLHPKRLKKRGYNQAEEIAKGMAQILQIPVIGQSLVRVKFADSLVTQGRQSRYNELENSFELRNEQCRGKHVLLLDDTLTTGATCISAGKVLLKGGVASLSIACMAVVR